MQVILLQKMSNLGNIGDTVEVKTGYARNYLFPQNKALRATKENKEYFKTLKDELEAKHKKEKEAAEKLISSIKGKTLTVIRQAGETGRLYGSVSPKDIAHHIHDELKVELQGNQVALANPIKEVGIYEVGIELHTDVKTIVRVNVARSQDEAELALEKEKEEKEETKKKEKKEADKKAKSQKKEKEEKEGEKEKDKKETKTSKKTEDKAEKDAPKENKEKKKEANKKEASKKEKK